MALIVAPMYAPLEFNVALSPKTFFDGNKLTDKPSALLLFYRVAGGEAFGFHRVVALAMGLDTWLVVLILRPCLHKTQQSVV